MLSITLESFVLLSKALQRHHEPVSSETDCRQRSRDDCLLPRLIGTLLFKRPPVHAFR